MSRVEHANKWIELMCSREDGFKKNIELLDQYNFSEFLSEGRSLVNLVDVIEEKYDKEFWSKYQYYVFNDLALDDIEQYFTSRYNVWFQEYTDWVVRKEDGANSEVGRRT